MYMCVLGVCVCVCVCVCVSVYVCVCMCACECEVIFYLLQRPGLACRHEETTLGPGFDARNA